MGSVRGPRLWRESKQGLLKPLPIPERTFAKISIDLITDLPPSKKRGFTFCMVVVDRLSKAPLIEGMKDTSTQAVSKRSYRVFYPYYDISHTLTSDRGSQFVSDVWKHFCRLLNVKRRLSTSNHPQTDGSTETMNQEVEKILRIFCHYSQDD